MDNIENQLIEDMAGIDDTSNDVPFDSNDIEVKILPKSVGQLIDMLEYNEIYFPKNRDFQNRWDIRKKSLFIESLILNLPIPLLCVCEDFERGWAIVDGLQRILTLQHFIYGNQLNEKSVGTFEEAFCLTNLEFKKDLEGNYWDDLPRAIQRRILTSQISVHVLGQGVSEKLQKIVYQRMNK